MIHDLVGYWLVGLAAAAAIGFPGYTLWNAAPDRALVIADLELSADPIKAEPKPVVEAPKVYLDTRPLAVRQRKAIEKREQAERAEAEGRDRSRADDSTRFASRRGVIRDGKVVGWLEDVTHASPVFFHEGGRAIRSSGGRARSRGTSSRPNRPSFVQSHARRGEFGDTVYARATRSNGPRIYTASGQRSGQRTIAHSRPGGRSSRDQNAYVVYSRGR